LNLLRFSCGRGTTSYSILDLHSMLLFVTTNKYSKHLSNLLGIGIDTSLNIILIQCFELAKQPQFLHLACEGQDIFARADLRKMSVSTVLSIVSASSGCRVSN
jgi:hypothetical protein